MIFRLPAAAAAISVFALAACGQGGDSPAPAAGEPTATEKSGELNLAPIDEAKLRERIKTLASDEFEGRAPATPGGAKTREYLISQMKEIGLAPGRPLTRRTRVLTSLTQTETQGEPDGHRCSQ